MKDRLAPVIITLLLLEAVTGYSQPHQDRRYYQIKVNDKIGFINSSGKVIIEPQFAAAGNFVDGLAPARKDAFYGYIDTTGSYVIQPIYDLARDFDHGVAKVFTDTVSSYIQTNGKVLFTGLDWIRYSINGLWVCRTNSNRSGVIRTDGKIIIDTIYNDIEPRRYNNPTGNFIIVKLLDGTTVEPPYYTIPDNALYAIMDDKADKLLDFHPAHILYFEENGLAIEADTNGVWSIIEVKGKKVFSYLYDEFSAEPNFNDSVVVLYANKDAVFHLGKIDTLLNKGSRILFNPFTKAVSFLPPTLSKKPSDSYFQLFFTNGYATYRDHDGLVVTIDKNGKKVAVHNNADEVPDQFKLKENGNVIIEYYTDRDKTTYGVISYDGTYLVPPIYSFLRETANPYCFFYSYQDSELYTIYGFINSKSGKKYVFPKADFTHESTYDYIEAYIDNKLTYISYSGEILWQDLNQRSKGQDFINIDEKDLVAYRARQVVIRVPKEVNKRGWDLKTTFLIVDSFPSLSINDLKLSVNTTDRVRDRDSILHYTMTVFNGTDADKQIPNNCRNDHYVMQAKDVKGEWRDIEYSQCTGCAIDKGFTTIPPKHFMKYDVPIYKGGLKTKLRIKGDFKGGDVYSNEFDGSINPVQFWRKIIYGMFGGIYDDGD
jgi:bifunctional DNA-binding transcriptional regulator/antitoxin component of YhaV-PrlF toxin-antitoxin module